MLNGWMKHLRAYRLSCRLKKDSSLHNSVLPERVHEQKQVRTKYIEKWLSSSIANEITLSRFDFEETCEFIKNVLAITTSPAAFCTEMFRYTEGNPGFIIDAITALFKEGKLYIDDSGQWSTDFDEDADYSRLYIPQACTKLCGSISILWIRFRMKLWKQFLLLTCLSLLR